MNTTVLMKWYKIKNIKKGEKNIDITITRSDQNF